MERLKEYKLVIALIILFIFGSIIVLIQPSQVIDDHSPLAEIELSSAPSSDGLHDKALNDATSDQSNGLTDQPSLYVDIKGEVYQPGVYRVRNNMRVIDAIEMAGGFSPEASIRYVNLAMKVHDEMVIYVPNVNEQAIEEKLDLYTGQNHDKIRINSATIEELTSLPGIGQKKAEAIIQYIEQHGPFQTMDDLVNVSGIGEKTIAAFAEIVQVP